MRDEGHDVVVPVVPGPYGVHQSLTAMIGTRETQTGARRAVRVALGLVGGICGVHSGRVDGITALAVPGVPKCYQFGNVASLLFLGCRVGQCAGEPHDAAGIDDEVTFEVRGDAGLGVAPCLEVPGRRVQFPIRMAPGPRHGACADCHRWFDGRCVAAEDLYGFFAVAITEMEERQVDGVIGCRLRLVGVGFAGIDAYPDVPTSPIPSRGPCHGLGDAVFVGREVCEAPGLIAG